MLITSIAGLVLAPVFYRPDTETGGAVDEAPLAPMQTHSEFLDTHPVTDTICLEIKKLVLDANTQPRVQINPDTVAEYAEVIKKDVADGQPIRFPAITVFRDLTGRCIPADGFHRIAAHKEAKVKEILCNIIEGTERDALLYSFGVNATHGERRTTKDKQRVVKMLVNDPEWCQMPNTEIAEFAQVSEAMVRTLRPAKTPTVRTVTRGGKTLKMDTAGIGRGKGAGKKGAKSAAKKAKAGKNGAATTEGAKSAAKKSLAEQFPKEITKVRNAIGDENGGLKIEQAICDGSLGLNSRDIQDWAGMKPESIRKIEPLVCGGTRMKPMKALEFIKSELPEKVLTDLHNRAIGNGGEWTHKGDGFTIVVKHGK